jgi:hypothetical protein
MAEREKKLRRKIFLGALVVLVAMAAWVLIIDTASRH